MMKTLIPLAIALVVPAAADAGGIDERTSVMMATAACQSALPVFDGVIRKRPLAVQNEGDSTSFITCGFEGRFYAVESVNRLGVILTNTGDEAATVNCTLVDGRNSIADPVYRPKSIELPANASSIELGWSPSDNEGASFIYPAVSCAIPPGIGIKAVIQMFITPPA